MPELKISVQKGSNGKNLLISDGTEWPLSGIERDHFNLVLFGFAYTLKWKKKVDTEFTGSTKTVSLWTFPNAPDGSYEFMVLAVQDHNPLLPYVKNSLVYFEEKVYRATKVIAEGTSITAENCWIRVESVDDILAMTSFPDSHLGIANYFKDDLTNICIGEKAIAYARQDCGCSDKCSMIEDYAWTKIYYSAAVYSFSFGDYAESGKFLEMAIARCNGNGTDHQPCNCH